MNPLLTFTLLLILSACCSGSAPQVKLTETTEIEKSDDYWLLIENYDVPSKFPPIGYASGYLNRDGDTMIALNKYPICYTDTFYFYAVVLGGENGGLIGINRKEEKLFNAVPTGDGYYIEEADGMIMIEENGKYGFANHKGEIVIKPQYTCVSNFHNGKAEVSNDCSLSPEADEEHHIMKMNTSHYIDKKGNTVK